MFFPTDSQRGGSAFIIGAIPLRLGAAFLLLHQHVWSQLPQAVQALWNAKSWDVIGAVTQSGLPFPKFLALAATVIVVLVTAGWLLGFLTRVCAFLLLPVTLGALLVCNSTGDAAGAETSLLYFFIAVTIMLAGPGWLSLDAIFKRRRGNASKPRYNL